MDSVYKSKTFLEAEETFLKRFRPVVEARKALTKLGTVEYFKSILSDEVEKQLWMAFITGMAPKMDGCKIVKDEQGNVVMENIELDPISWNAFRRAVEYKRGMPLVTVEDNT